MDGRPIYFVSDVHLRPGDDPGSALARDLHAFLDHVHATGAALYVLGDLFDFWFEYRHAVIGHYLPTLRHLAELARGGVPVTFLPGNHDFWAGDGLRSFGVQIATAPHRVTLQGRRALLTHGDGLGVREPWTWAFRRVVRSRSAIAAFRLLSPDVGVPLALAVSRVSRRFSGDRVIDPDAVRRRVLPALDLEGIDLVLLGHYHQPTHTIEQGRDFALIADFLRRRSYARLLDGALTLERWGEEESGAAGAAATGGAGG